MDRSIARLNIEHFRHLLATETDEAKRKMIALLLAEEEEKLRVAKPPIPKQASFQEEAKSRQGAGAGRALPGRRFVSGGPSQASRQIAR